MSVPENSLKMEDDSEEEKQLRLDDHTEEELNNTEGYDATTRSKLSETLDEDVTTSNSNQKVKPKMDDDAKVLMEFATLFTETTSTGNDFSSPTKQIPVPTSTLLPHTSVLNQPPKPPSTMIIPVPFSSGRASSSEDSSGSLPTTIPLAKIKTPSSTKKTKKDSSPNKPKRQTKSYKEEFLTVDQTEPKKKRGRPPGTKKDAGKKKKDTEDAPSTPQSKKNKLDGFPNSEVTNQQLKGSYYLKLFSYKHAFIPTNSN